MARMYTNLSEYLHANDKDIPKPECGCGVSFF